MRLSRPAASPASTAAPSSAQHTYSVHVHTDDAGAAVEAGLAAGRLSRIVISALSSGGPGLPASSRPRAARGRRSSTPRSRCG
ncbi:hypothetical protein MAHJHV55_54450 [Mycobacterium avium subsp. hominissuis]